MDDLISSGALPPLRDYQTESLNALRRSIQAGNSRIVMQAPTGAGKTLVSAHIIKNHLDKGGKPMFCVDAISLVDQTAQEFYKFGLHDIGVIQAQHPMTNPHASIQIASIQTLSRRQLPEGITLVIVDENHCQYDSMYKIMDSWQDVIFIGLTATPYAKGMGKHWDALVRVTTTQELIDRGYLSDFRVFAPSNPDLTGVKTVRGDYHEGQLSDVMSDKTLVGEVYTHWRKYGTEDKTLIYCVDRAHAQHVFDLFTEKGVPVGYVDAFTDLVERRNLKRQFHSGEIKAVVNIGVLTKGVDWDVRTLILDRPTKSKMLFQQVIGRSLRTAEGKDHAIIIDMSSTTSRLGFVTDMELEFTELDDGKKSKSGRQEPPEKLPKECPSCKYLKPAGVHECPECGFAPKRQPTVEKVEGDLVEVKRLKVKERRNREWTAEQKYRFLYELHCYARSKGYKSGWAAFKYKAKMGVWPNKIPKPDNVDPNEFISDETLGFIRSENIKHAYRKQIKKIPERH